MMKKLEKWGTSGALLAAILCPVCFPKLALIGAALGLGVLAPYEGWFAAAAQVFLVVALLGHAVAYRRHRNAVVLVLAGVGVALVLGSLWLHYVETVIYSGLAAVVTATLWSVLLIRRIASRAAAAPAYEMANPVQLESTITCPLCGHRKRESMPTDACQFFYECDGCQRLLRPRPGHCCVYCSYGDTACPPMQSTDGGACCGSRAASRSLPA